MSKHVYIFVPTYTGAPRIETMFCLMDLQKGLAERGWDATWKFTVGDSIIPRSRNMAVADFLSKKQCTDLVMLDDDLEWEPGAVIRLLQHNCDVVGGLYPKRQEKLEFPVKRLKGVEPDPKTGLLEVRFLPTGFLRMTRTCLETMVAKYEHLSYVEELVDTGKAWCLFWFELLPDDDDPDGPKQMWGEDYTFCRRWRALGGKVYGDTFLRFKHFGKKGYEGCYAETIPGFLDSLTSKSAA
jgi:hypothetical protein